MTEKDLFVHCPDDHGQGFDYRRATPADLTACLQANAELRREMLDELFGLGRKDRETFWAELPAPVTGHISGLKLQAQKAEARVAALEEQIRAMLAARGNWLAQATAHKVAERLLSQPQDSSRPESTCGQIRCPTQKRDDGDVGSPRSRVAPSGGDSGLPSGTGDPAVITHEEARSLWVNPAWPPPPFPGPEAWDTFELAGMVLKNCLAKFSIEQQRKVGNAIKAYGDAREAASARELEEARQCCDHQTEALDSAVKGWQKTERELEEARAERDEMSRQIIRLRDLLRRLDASSSPTDDYSRQIDLMQALRSVCALPRESPSAQPSKPAEPAPGKGERIQCAFCLGEWPLTVDRNSIAVIRGKLACICQSCAWIAADLATEHCQPANPPPTDNAFEKRLVEALQDVIATTEAGEGPRWWFRKLKESLEQRRGSAMSKARQLEKKP